MKEESIELSAALTGFSRIDLQGTGVAELYWNTLVEKAGEQTSNDLLEAWQSISKRPSETLETNIRDVILGDPDLGPAARNLIKMWYLGQWADECIVSGEAYQQGLVWDAIDAHPQGAKQQGFGTWSLPPKGLNKTRKP